MSSSFQGKPDAPQRHVSDQEPAVFPEGAPATDDSPTVISKTNPLVEGRPSDPDKLADLARKASSPEAIVASLRGKRLAQYELIEPIGVGGMAAVIRARDTQLDRMVALKILPPEMALQTENVQRFHQEAKAAAKLDHENIARVFFCGEDQGLHFIAFEFVEGMNLRTLLEQRGRLPVAEAVRYVLQIATGLEHATSRGVVHRDVKPSNIIIMPSGQAKLVDMGLARNLERHSERDLTQSGVTLGTFDYISPEQALEPREADARSDIYSLGCTLYHMLTGLPPVPEGTPAKKLQHHQHHAPVDPRQIDPSIPDEMVTILGKMMAKDPRDRYQRPIHLVQHLLQLGQKLGITEGLPEVIVLSDAGLPAGPRRRPMLFIGMSLAALVVVVLLMSLGMDPGPVVPPPPPEGNHAKGPPVVSPKPNPGPLPTPAPEFVKNRDDLRKVLGDTSYEVKATLNLLTDIDLDGIETKMKKDQRLVLESDDAATNILRFHYKDSSVPFGLVIEDGEEIVLRGLRFEIDSDAVTPTVPVATVTVRGGKRVRFKQCIFAQPKVRKITANRVPLASVLIDTPEEAEQPPEVFFDECYFQSNLQAGQSGGQVAIAINGAATVHVTNCAFRPHGAFFSFRDKCTLEHTILNVKNCTGFVETGPAFRFGKSAASGKAAAARVRVQGSAFLRPNKGLGSDVTGQPGLIFLDGDARVQYHGQQNLYSHLNSLVERRAEAEIIDKYDVFKSFLASNQGSDDSTCIDPLDLKSALAHANALQKAEDDVLAFSLKVPYHQSVGLLRDWHGKLMPTLAAEVVEGIKKVVDPDADGNTPGVRKSIAGHLAELKNGDVIWIKHGKDREVKVKPGELAPGVTVTLKAFSKEYQPILVFDTQYRDKDSHMFKVRDGTLRIENMEILLAPDHKGYEIQSMFHLGESARLIFKNCVLTMRSFEDVKCNVVTFIDLDRMMKMGPAAPSKASVEFSECFIRGKGDLVGLRGCRLLPVSMDDCLVALDGSLLDINATDKEMAMNLGVRWTMKRSSVFTTKSVFALHSKAEKGLTETNAIVENCLLASLVPDMPAVLFDMTLDRPEDVNKCFKWQGNKNYFANYEVLKIREWKGLDPEHSEYGPLSFPKINEKALQRLWEATPDWFKVAETEQKSIAGFGIREEVEKRLLPSPEPDE